MHQSSALWYQDEYEQRPNVQLSHLLFPSTVTAIVLCLLVPCWLLSHYYRNQMNLPDLISSLAKCQCRHWDKDWNWKTNQILSWSHRDCMCEQSLGDLASWEEAKSKALKLRSNANVTTYLCVVHIKQGEMLKYHSTERLCIQRHVNLDALSILNLAR